MSNISHPRNPGVVKKCAFCGKNFKSRKKYCSRPCKDKGSTIPAEELILKIKTFVKRHGRIPLKREMLNYHAFRLRFGTWNQAVKAAGFIPNPVMFANKFVAKDGHKCDSLAERIIDDWLYARKIKHERNTLYPGDQGLKVDFKVRNYWVEFFGLSGESRKYDRLKRKKLRLAKKLNLKLVGIYLKDLFPKGRLTERFAFLLE
ncbi:MAG: homing endonuclease associated repeat-containing protein [Patescibacteria group bacterium]